MRAVIIANGSISDYTAISTLILPEDKIIVADGGAFHAAQLGVFPHVLIGDLDSLGEKVALELQKKGTVVIRYPKEKDKTDTHLALEYAISLGAQQIIMLGMLGGRLDHALGNLLLPFHVAFKNLEIFIKDEEQDILPLVSNSQLVGKKGDVFSLIPLEEIKGLNIEGAKYPLKNADIAFGSSLTISNEFCGEKVFISWREGSKILLVRIRNNKKE